MTIVDSINAVHTRLVRNKRIWCALVIGVALSYTTLVVKLVGFIARPLGWVIGLGLLGAAIYGAYRRRLLAPPTIEDASAIIDRKFETKDRALTLAATWEETGEAEKELLTRQLEAIVPAFDVDAALPFTLEPRLKRALLTLPLVWGCLWYMGPKSTASNGAAERQATIVSELLEQRADIPLAVRESLVELKNTLETKPLTDQAVIDALTAAQAEIDQASAMVDGEGADASDDTVDESDVATGDSGGEIADERPSDAAPIGAEPTPTPEPTPTIAAEQPESKPNEVPTEEERREEEAGQKPKDEKKDQQESSSSNDTDVQHSTSSDQQGGSDKQQSQSKNDGGEGGSKSEQQQSGNQQGQSQGEQGQEGSEKGQEGDGDGNSSSKEGKQPGKSSGQSGAQGQSGQGSEKQGAGEGNSKQGGEKERGAKGNRSGDKTGAGQDTGLDQAQQALDKIEQALKAEQQGNEKGEQQGEKEGGEKGNKGESDSGQPTAGEGKKQGQSDKKAGTGQAQQGETEGAKDKTESEQQKRDQGGKGGGKGGQDGKPNNEARAEKGTQGDNEPKEEFGEPPKLPAGSSPPKESDAAMGPGDENGGLGEGLGDRKGFKDTEIKTGDEKYDARFTGKDGKIGRNKGPARVKTNLEDVKLAKPDPVKDPSEQPIPLEYRDILE